MRGGLRIFGAFITMLFSELGLHEALLRAVTREGYTTPTPIQAQAIPQVLKGGDVLAAAQTGTGKTAAFTLPILHRLAAQPAPGGKRAPRVLVLVPTRELAAQVGESVANYGRDLSFKHAVIFGGVNINPQIDLLRRGVDILVATPGRLLDLCGQRAADLSQVQTLVLDEADRMLDMGFMPDIKRVLALLPKQRQNLLFSATFSPEIRKLAEGLLHQPISIDIAPRNSAAESVDQRVIYVEKGDKPGLLGYMISRGNWQQVLVFTRTKHGANRLCERLIKDGLTAAALHGNKSQSARTKALAGFKSGAVRVLVATDIAARGIDIDQLPHVINYELPNVPEDYVHRIGRTGRAGMTGEALSLVSRGEESGYLKDIERLLKRTIPVFVVEGYTLSPPGQAPKEEERPPRPPQQRRQGRPGGGGGGGRGPQGRGGRGGAPVKPQKSAEHLKGMARKVH
jgi:ATP-dependent RNA helicase RhlE